MQEIDLNKISDNERTQKNFQSMINLLVELVGNNWFSFIQKCPRTTINRIIIHYKRKTGTANKNTLKNVFSRIVKILKSYDWKAQNKQAVIDLYTKEMMKHYKEVIDETDKSRVNASMSKNWATWEEILDVRDTLLNEAKDKQSYLDYLILSLYTYLPPNRLDFNEIYVVKKHGDCKDCKRNYIIYDKKNAYFVFNDYKTVKTYGTIIQKIPDDLRKVIDYWFKHYNKDMKFLLVEPNSKDPMTKKNLSLKVSKIFKTHLGKNIGVSLLRHIFISHMLPMLKTHGEKKAMAKAMAHSLELQSLYEKKEENKDNKHLDYDDMISDIMKKSTKGLKIN